MPELPEVETVKIGLSAFLPGRTVSSVESNWGKSFPNAQADVDKFLVGAKVMTVARRAKVLLIELDSKYSLVIHLKMTGQLVFVGQPPKREASNNKSQTPNKSQNSNDQSPKRLGFDAWDLGISKSLERFGGGHPTDSLIGELPHRSTRVIFTFTDGSKLFFNDQRKFGWVRLLPTAEVPQIDFFQKVGPEPLSADFTWKMLRERLNRRPNTNIKAALLDQTVIAGVGNIYADESLWGAKIHPSTLVKNLPDTKIKKLYEALVAVLKLAIEKGGSTDRNYVNAEGKRGSYLTFANVFRREGQPCPRCGTTIIKTKVAGRGTHICPKCQCPEY
jgi:formamidopyrimidine-DNA glycosylase